jgi:hypothetical protein
MVQRNFIEPTEKEIEERRKMYEEAEELGIDLMGYDGSEKTKGMKPVSDRKDIRKAVVLLGSGKIIPKDLKLRLLKQKQLS